MKRQQYTILFLGLAITLLCAACRRAAEVPVAISVTKATTGLANATPTNAPTATSTNTPTVTPTVIPTVAPTTIGEWQSLPAISLDCWEHEGDGQSWRQWRNTAFSDIDPGGLATDGDLLWISTRRGLFRLDVRTLECTAFTKADRFSLTEADQLLPTGKYLLLPDGEGGLWAGTKQGILRFSGGRWHMATRRMLYASAMGFRQTGDWCLEGTWGDRTFNMTGYLCFTENILSLFDRGCLVKGHLDVMDCRQWQRATGWRGEYFEGQYNYCHYNYTTPDGCEQIARQIASGCYSFITVSPDGAETWAIKDDHLLHLRKDEAEQVELPYQDVLALAADPVRSGVWMATEDGLVHGKVRTTIKGEVPSTQYVFQPFSLNPGAFPGSARSFAVDKNDLWTISLYDREHSIVRYDELGHTWQSVTTVMSYYIGAIATDPVRGVWVVGYRKLAYFDGVRWQTWPISDVGSPTALLANENGRVWMGSARAGVWTTVPQAQSTEAAGNEHPELDWRKFTVEDGLADERITSLARGPDGRIYAAHYAGISVFDPAAGVENGRWITLPGSDADLGGWINALAFAPPDAGGALWVGYYSSAALRRYQDGQWTDYHLSPGVKSYSYSIEKYNWFWAMQQGIGALLVDRDGALWVGTVDGLLRWPAAGEGEPRWQTFDVNVLTMRNVLALAQDDQGRIWVGGEEGVAMWEGDR